jgi:hypothetical protein
MDATLCAILSTSETGVVTASKKKQKTPRDFSCGAFAIYVP